MSNKVISFFFFLVFFEFYQECTAFKIFLFLFSFNAVFWENLYFPQNFSFFMETYKSVYRIVCHSSYIQISIFRACISLVCTPSCHKNNSSPKSYQVFLCLFRETWVFKNKSCEVTPPHTVPLPSSLLAGAAREPLLSTDITLQSPGSPQRHP